MRDVSSLSSGCGLLQIWGLDTPRRYSPAFFHNSSTRRFTSADISITPGHGRIRKCRVLWRSDDAMRVQFVDRIASAEEPYVANSVGA